MQWVAYYEDGSWLRQFNDDSKENRYADIDRSRLRSFALYDIPATRKILHVHLDPEQRLIYRRRVEQRAGSPETTVVHLVGWQQTVKGRNVQSIAYVLPDGTVELSGAWRESHPWFYSVELLPMEGELCLA